MYCTVSVDNESYYVLHSAVFLFVQIKYLMVGFCFGFSVSLQLKRYTKKSNKLLTLNSDEGFYSMLMTWRQGDMSLWFCQPLAIYPIHLSVTHL